MDKYKFCCLFFYFSETTVKGTVSTKIAGKEDPVELDFSLQNYFNLSDVEYVGVITILKYHKFMI